MLPKPYLSIVSPVYRAESLIHTLVSRVASSCEKISPLYEIILVEDGSPDHSWEKIEEVCQKYPQTIGIQLSRNFGQHYAITAGLAQAQGEWIVVMDCDLQDQPEEIPALYQKAREGYDMVFAQRVNRQDSFLKRWTSKAFYTVFGYLTGTEQDSSIANFGIYHRNAIQAILSMKDHIRYFPTMSQWVGFKKAKLPVQHAEREEGTSSYSWKRLFRLAFENIIAFSDKPLRLTIRLGIFITFCSFLLGLYYLYLYLTGAIFVQGFASLIISIWFLSGVIIFVLGIVGVYVGSAFDRVKDRPSYLIRKIYKHPSP